MKQKNKSLADVLETKKKIQEIEAYNARVREALAAEESRQAAADDIRAALPGMMQEKEDRLADLMLGKGRQKDLDALRDEIAQAQASIATSDGIHESVAGLRRKEQVLLDELRGLQERSLFPAKRDYLLAEAEELGAEYLQAARNLVKIYRRLLALDSFLAPMGHGFSYGFNRDRRICLLRFSLDCHAGSRLHGMDDVLAETEELNSHHATTLRMEDAEAERIRLAGLGVEI